MAQFLSIPVTSEGNQLISARNVLLVEQASTTTVTVTYASGSASGDILTITHAATGAGVYVMRDLIQDALVLAHDPKSAPAVVIDVTVSSAVSGIAIA